MASTTILSDNGVSSGSAGLKTTASNDGILALQTTTAGGTATTAVTIGTDQSVTFAQAANLPNTFGFKNRIINGAMVIDQRNAGANVNNTTSNLYVMDRWFMYGSVSSKFSIQQNAGSVTPPAGFKNYCGVTSLSAFTPSTSQLDYFAQYIEGYNISDLAWGTANASAITVSFWARSSLTGAFSGCVTNGTDRSYPFTYTINSANTWEYKTVTVAGDTTGTWGSTNGVGIVLRFNLGSGSDWLGTANTWSASNLIGASTGATSLVGTNGATLYITGVQLEKRSTATSFDFRSYGQELAMCQRYYYRITQAAGPMAGLGMTYSSTLGIFLMQFPVTMRAAPSSIEQSGTPSHYAMLDGASLVVCTGGPTFNHATVYGATWESSASGLTTGRAIQFRSNNASAYLGWSAEL